MERGNKDINKMFLEVLFVLLLGLINVQVDCFPSGPPRSACADGLPVHSRNGHLIKAQDSPSPYVITVNSTNFRPGETLSIKIHSPQGEMFKGLFVQVRPLARPDEEYFKSAPLGEYYRRVMNTKPSVCVNSQDTLVHKDPFMKIETKFDWKAPLLVNHDVVVTATILKDFATFWINVESPRIELQRDPVLPAETLQEPWLLEMVRSVRAGQNATRKQHLVQERFERGFKGAFDPNGYIMVQYLNDMLPFEDRFESQIKTVTVIQNTTLTSDKSSGDTPSDTVDIPSIRNEDESETSSSLNGEPTVEIPLGVTIKKGNSSSKSEYENLVASLLRGDYSQIDRLEQMLTNDSETVTTDDLSITDRSGP